MMMLVFATRMLAGLLVAQASAASPSEYVGILDELTLDENRAYQVAEIEFDRADLSFRLDGGTLVFAKRVGDRDIAALYLAVESDSGGRQPANPPSKTEAYSLVRLTGQETLREAFQSAVFVFAGGTAVTLLEAIEK